MKINLYNEHEVNEYFCNKLADNWERINIKIINNKFVFDSAVNYHTKLLKRGISSKSQKYWDLIDEQLYKKHKDRLAKYFSFDN